jgi:hypothetical protein
MNFASWPFTICSKYLWENLEVDVQDDDKEGFSDLVKDANKVCVCWYFNTSLNDIYELLLGPTQRKWNTSC